MDEAGPDELRARSLRYIRLKQGIQDARALQALSDLAAECEAKAIEAEARSADLTQREHQRPEH